MQFINRRCDIRNEAKMNTVTSNETKFCFRQGTDASWLIGEKEQNCWKIEALPVE